MVGAINPSVFIHVDDSETRITRLVTASHANPCPHPSNVRPSLY